mmetsp:Transcript_49743/g.118597  ORF Transcript_49743/g.118597 Transcript_49743/m.118597 type:complete len:103 (-) Transcript_49743:207-515(-)
MEPLLDILVPHLYDRFVVRTAIRHYREGPQLDVSLNNGVLELPANQTLCIKNGVRRIAGHLILSSITNEPLLLCPCDIGGSRSVPLIIGYDLHLTILVDTHT